MAVKTVYKSSWRMRTGAPRTRTIDAKPVPDYAARLNDYLNKLPYVVLATLADASETPVPVTPGWREGDEPMGLDQRLGGVETVASALEASVAGRAAAFAGAGATGSWGSQGQGGTAGGAGDRATNTGTISGGGGDPSKYSGATGAWWTPERVEYGTKYLMEHAGLPEVSARALVARWAGVEAGAGPEAVNPSSGAVGIAQWLGSRKPGTPRDFEGQLAKVVGELTGTGGQEYQAQAARTLMNATTEREAAEGAAQYERAEGWNGRVDNYVGKTIATMRRIKSGENLAPGAKADTTPDTKTAAESGDTTAKEAPGVARGRALQAKSKSAADANATTASTEAKADAATAEAQQTQTIAATGRTLYPKQNGQLHPTEAGMDPGLRGSLLQMANDSPYGGAKLMGPRSGYRTYQQQVDIYRTSRPGYAARPGTSRHGYGVAADLSFSSAAERKWYHDNASRYGIYFPMSYEPWHAQKIGPGGPGAGTQVAQAGPQAGAAARARGMYGYGGTATAQAGGAGTFGGGGARFGGSYRPGRSLVTPASAPGPTARVPKGQAGVSATAGLGMPKWMETYVASLSPRWRDVAIRQWNRRYEYLGDVLKSAGKGVAKATGIKGVPGPFTEAFITAGGEGDMLTDYRQHVQTRIRRGRGAYPGAQKKK